MQISGIWILFTYLANNTTIGQFLPISPFQRWFANWDGWQAIQGFMGYLNWFIPVSTLLDILSLWASAIIIFYGVQAILRWVKIVGD